jgi:hypothetical protein
MSPHDTITHLQQVMGHEGQQAFATVPMILAKVINKKLWRERLDKEGKPFQSFEAFVQHPLWHGLESSIDDLLAFCRRRQDVRKLIAEELAPMGKKGANQYVGCDNITSTPQRGTSASYRRKRLKGKRPDLYQHFLDGELTLIAAEIEAGIKKAETPLDRLRAYWKKASEQERRTFLKEVS